MFGNYFKTAWRNLIRNKVFSIINISGLAIGLACSLLILCWVQDERRTDQFHEHRERLYVVYQREYADGEVGASYTTAGVLGEELNRVIPEISHAAGYRYDQQVFRTGSKVWRADGAYAGADFFRMFSFPLLYGQADKALAAPGSIAISKKMAVLFFGSPEAAIGKLLRGAAPTDLLVTAVFDDFPKKSSLQFSYIINWQTFLDTRQGARRWDAGICQTAIMLGPHADPATVSAKIRRFLDKYYTNQGPGLRVELGIQPFHEQYLYSNFRNGQPDGGRIAYVRLFSLVAVFILLIACINFMNLTTARSAKRAKEIGVRKVVGAGRMVLVRQFISEAVLLAFMAMFIALLLVCALLTVFNQLTGKQIVLPLLQPQFWLQLLALGLVTGLVAGSYPALFLSSLQPVRVLKGILSSGKGGAGFRKGLVVFQFALSILLIIGTLVVSRQVHYIRTKHLGYDRENLVFIPLEGDLGKQYQLFKQQALQLPGVKQLTRMTGSPVGIGNYQDAVQWEGMEPGYRPTFAITNVDYDFARAMRVHLVQGRDFSPAFPTDSTGFVVNESAVRKMGYQHPLGKRIMLEDGRKGTIIGVVRDFHIASLHDPIYPMIIAFGNKGWGNILVRTEAGSTPQALAGLERLCKQLNPGYPFSFQFSDEAYQRLYASEQVVQKLSNHFAFIAIFISCMGLLGLSLFTAEQRKKEIGIRKTLGASVAQLFSLLSKEFLLLVLIAFIIAGPLAWLVMNRWLEGYVYRTGISWWVFAAAGTMALAAALATVGYQAARAALANPAKSLRVD